MICQLSFNLFFAFVVYVYYQIIFFTKEYSEFPQSLQINYRIKNDRIKQKNF